MCGLFLLGSSVVTQSFREAGRFSRRRAAIQHIYSLDRRSLNNPLGRGDRDADRLPRRANRLSARGHPSGVTLFDEITWRLPPSVIFHAARFSRKAAAAATVTM